MLLRQRRLVEPIERTADVEAGPARRQVFAQSDSAHGLGDRGRSRRHITGYLWPRRQCAVDLQQRRGTARRQLLGVEEAQHVRNLLPARHPRQRGRIHLAQQAVQDRPLRLEVEPFHVDQAPIAGRHQHRNPPGPRPLSHDRLHVQRITFFDNDIQSIEKFVDGIQRQSRVHNLNGQIRIELGDSAGGHFSFVQPDVEYGRRHTVQVGKFKVIEIRQPKHAAQSLRRKSVRDDMSSAQPGNTDTQFTQSRLLFRGDHVSVAIQPHRPKTPRAEHRHNRPPPGVIRPSAGLGGKLRARRWQQPPQLGELGVAMVDELDDRIVPQLVQHGLVGGILGVEYRCRACCDGHSSMVDAPANIREDRVKSGRYIVDFLCSPQYVLFKL